MKINGGSVDFAQRGGLNGPPRNFDPCTFSCVWNLNVFCSSGPIRVPQTENFKVYPNGVVLGEEPGPGCPFLVGGGLLSLLVYPTIPCFCIGVCCLFRRSINVHGMIFSISRYKNSVECTLCCKHWDSEEVTTFPNVQAIDVQMVRKQIVMYDPGGEDTASVPRHDLHFEVMHISYVDNGALKVYTSKELAHPRKHFYTRHVAGFFVAATFTPENFPRTSFYTPMINAVRALIANNQERLQQMPRQQLMYRPLEPQLMPVQSARSGYAMAPLGQKPGYVVATAVPVHDGYY